MKKQNGFDMQDEEAYIFYTHSDYSDVWPILIGQTNKYLKNKKKYLFTNNLNNFSFDEWTVLLYDETDSYQKRFFSCLEQVDSDIVIFHHEDMFLLKQPNIDLLNKLIFYIKNNKYDLIKLCKASYDDNFHQLLEPNIYKNPNNLLFSIQPTIIKKSLLLSIYKHTNGNNIWEFEKNSNNLVNFMNLNSCYYFDSSETKRGLFHWDSNLYPYIATAVVKGKWDYESYNNELSILHDAYKIDPSLRGKNV